MSLKPEERHKLQQEFPDYVRDKESVIWKVPQPPKDEALLEIFNAGRRYEAMRSLNKPQARKEK